MITSGRWSEGSNGRISTRSITAPIAALINMPTKHGDPHRQPAFGGEHEHDEGPEHRHLTLREVDQRGRLVDDDERQRDQAVRGTVGEAVEDAGEEEFHGRLRSDSEVGLADRVVVDERVGRALDGDLAGLEDVATVGDAERESAFCSTISIVVPVSRLICWKRSKRSLTMIGARPSDGSSSRSTSGRDIKARDTANICCSPPERLPACWLRVRAARDRSRTTSPCRRRPRLSLRTKAPTREVVLDGEFGERAATLRDVARARAARCRPGPCRRVLARRRSTLPVVSIMPADRPQGGGLAGAVGSEDHDDLAVVDMEVEPVQDLDRPIPPRGP